MPLSYKAKLIVAATLAIAIAVGMTKKIYDEATDPINIKQSIEYAEMQEISNLIENKLNELRIHLNVAKKAINTNDYEDALKWVTQAESLLPAIKESFLPTTSKELIKEHKRLTKQISELRNQLKKAKK